jgi:hypothetical protein
MVYNGAYDEVPHEHLREQRAEDSPGTAIRQNWRACRRTDSPRHRCLSGCEKEGIEVKKRCSIYTRVSTADQHPETQLYDLREMAKQRGYEITHEYSDTISGAKSKRPGLDQLMADARTPPLRCRARRCIRQSG